jgi:hypothetical protein
MIACLVTVFLLVSYLFSFPGRRVMLPHSPYLLIVQPGVSEQSVNLVRDGLTEADQFLNDVTGMTLETEAEVRLASFSPCSPLQPLPQLGATAQVVGNRLCVNTLSGVWQDSLNNNTGFAFSVIAHEHYHLLQHQLGCLSSPWQKQYDWLIEGGASYVGWETAITAGKLQRESVTTLLTTMRATDKLGTLKSYEHGIGGDASYSLAYQAVQHLVNKTGSVRSLNDFCSRVGHGENWRDAFAHTFGITLEDFYGTFEAIRARGSP